MELRTEETMSAIKNRTKVLPPRISTCKLLKSYDMGLYISICLKPISDYIDGNHIMFDISTSGLDIVFDKTGLNIIQNILSGYVPESHLVALDKYMTNSEAIANCQNEQINILRSCKDIKTLKELITNYSYWFGDEQASAILQLVRAEIKARRPFNRLRVLIRSAINKIMRLTYENILKFQLKYIIRKIWKEI